MKYVKNKNEVYRLPCTVNGRFYKFKKLTKTKNPNKKLKNDSYFYTINGKNVNVDTALADPGIKTISDKQLKKYTNL